MSHQLCLFYADPKLGFYAPESLLAADYCGYKADIFSLGCVCLELLLLPDSFRLIWLSAYTKANVVSKSYAKMNPNINSNFVFEIKSSIESIGSELADSDFLGDDLAHNTLTDILNFHPGNRPSLNFLLETAWISLSNEEIAYKSISSAIFEKSREQCLHPPSQQARAVVAGTQLVTAHVCDERKKIIEIESISRCRLINPKKNAFGQSVSDCIDEITEMPISSNAAEPKVTLSQSSSLPSTINYVSQICTSNEKLCYGEVDPSLKGQRIRMPCRRLQLGCKNADDITKPGRMSGNLNLSHLL